MRDLVDRDYPHADKVRVVMDNLSTHTASAVYQTFPAAEARRILRCLEFHYTPRHASWLNMAEIEIGVMRRQCLDRRIASRELLETEVRAWERRRTESGAQIRWMFSTDQARAKMAKSYPTPTLNES
jgi:DDE superfamily endonuclease